MHKVTSRTALAEKGKSEEVLENGSGTSLDNWRRTLSGSSRYRIGGASIHLKITDLMKIFAIICVIFVIILIYIKHQSSLDSDQPVETRVLPSGSSITSYDSTYPLSKPVKVKGGTKYRIGLIADLDHDSKVDSALWQSFFLKGYFTVFENKTFAVQLESSSTQLHSSLAQGGRGMELSELVVFDGKLITVDDRTGVVYKIVNDEVIPWVILPDGNGEVSKGFKAEWATVKDGNLYVGGLGKEWTSQTGEVLNFNPQYVKRIEPDGSVEHLDWHKIYDKIKYRAGFPSPGYMIHESGAWSSVHRKWFFLPRRASTEKYDDKLDERRATNILITCDETLKKVDVMQPFGPHSLTHGFSSFKFIPDVNDEYILALKSEEDNGKTASYMLVLDLNGNVLMPETRVGNFKYEGIEFI